MHLIVVSADLGRFWQRPYLTRRGNEVALVFDRRFDATRAGDLIAGLRRRPEITSMEVVYLDSADPDWPDCRNNAHDYRGVHIDGHTVGTRCQRCGDFVPVDPYPAPDRVLLQN